MEIGRWERRRSMNYRTKIVGILLALLVIGGWTSGMIFNGNVVEATARKAISYADYEGLWLDSAFIEDESWTSSMQLTLQKGKGSPKAEIALNVEQNEVVFLSSAKHTIVTFDSQGLGEFNFKYQKINISDEEDAKILSGSGTIHLGPNRITLSLKGVPEEIKAIFSKSRTMIRDPYANAQYSRQDVENIVSQSCQCTPSKIVEFLYPVADNEGNKNWIHYIVVAVRDIPVKGYKVNLHKRKAEEDANFLDNWYATDDNIKIKKIVATSMLSSTKQVSYEAGNLIDRNPNTCWCEGIKGSGIGEGFTITFEKETAVHYLTLLNGYGKSVSAYLNNGSVKKAKLAFADGTEIIADMTKGRSINLFDYGYNEIKTTWITLTILEVYPGAKYDDTCISEVGIS